MQDIVKAFFASLKISPLILLMCCSGNENSIRNGAGLNVYSIEFEDRSQLLDAYSNRLCRHAILPVQSDGTCDYQKMKSNEWTTFVNAGMYDIDARCDAYLSWLHSLKRNREPFLEQLGQTRSLVEAILNISSASSNAITVTGLALGYAADTFTNVSSRLLFELDTSTVQKLVLARQATAKKSIYALEFNDRPSALHALRGYLRICMPFTIETDVNVTVVSNASGNTNPDKVVDINSATTGAKPLKASDPVPSGPIITEDERIEGYKTTFEGQIKDSDLAMIQRYFCVSPAPRYGPRTRFNIELWERLNKTTAGTVNGQLNSKEGNKLIVDAKKSGDCDVQKYKNFFERTRLIKPTDFKTFRDKLSEKLNDPTIKSKTSLAELRVAIVKYQTDNSLALQPGAESSEVTPRLYVRVTR